MSRTVRLLGHKVSDHIGGGSKKRLDIALLGMLTAEVILHVDMTSGGLVGRMK